MTLLQIFLYIGINIHYLLPDRKPPISQITALEKNFNPQNTQCIPPAKILDNFKEQV